MRLLFFILSFTILSLFAFSEELNEQLHIVTPFELREAMLQRALEPDIIEKEKIGQELYDSWQEAEDGIKERLNAILIPESMRSYSCVTLRLRKNITLIYEMEFDGLNFAKYNDQVFGLMRKGYQKLIYDNYSLIKNQVLSAIK